MRTDADLINLVNASGVPLQLATEREVHRAKQWELLHREHAWSYGERSGFADLVIANKSNTVAVIECKRVRQSDWVFIIPEGAEKDCYSRIFVINTVGQGRSFKGFFDTRTTPSAFESEFCVMVGDDAKSRLLLERTASEVTVAAEAVAAEEFEQRLERLGYGYRSYISVIVTTARLSVCAVDEQSISLATGETAAAHTSVQEVPWVRFRKQLTNDMAVATPDLAWNPRALSKAKEKVVYVVNAEHFATFLEKWSVVNEDLRPLMRMFDGQSR